MHWFKCINTGFWFISWRSFVLSLCFAVHFVDTLSSSFFPSISKYGITWWEMEQSTCIPRTNNLCFPENYILLWGKTFGDCRIFWQLQEWVEYALPANEVNLKRSMQYVAGAEDQVHVYRSGSRRLCMTTKADKGQVICRGRCCQGFLRSCFS